MLFIEIQKQIFRKINLVKSNLIKITEKNKFNDKLKCAIDLNHKLFYFYEYI